MDYYKGLIPIIDYATPEGRDLAHPKHATYGAVPRDYSVQPEEMFDSPDQMKLVEESDWDGEYDFQEANKNRQEHMVQCSDGKTTTFVNPIAVCCGYCCDYSTRESIMLLRI